MGSTSDASGYRRPCFSIVELRLEVFLAPWSTSIDRSILPVISKSIGVLLLVDKGGKSSNL